MVDKGTDEAFIKRKSVYTQASRYVYPAVQEKSKDIDVAKVILKRNEVPIKDRQIPKIIQSKTKSISDEYHYHRDSSLPNKNVSVRYAMDDSVSVLPDPYYIKQSMDPSKSKRFFYYANKHMIGSDTPDTRVSLNKEVLHETGKKINNDRVINMKSKNM
jgi:hypothetical protein